MFDLIALQANLHKGALDSLKALQIGGFEQIPALVALAFGFGLVHALLPGHGKLVLASHFAGRGSWRDAILSSVIVILTHVGSAIVIVLSGVAILKRTLAGAGRAPQLESLSHGLVVLIGLWLLYRALSGHDHAHENKGKRSGPMLALVAGLIPCPLTTFIMTYATVNGAIVHLLQEKAHGTLSPVWQRRLATLAKEAEQELVRASSKLDKLPPPTGRRQIKPGSRLVREWQGALHEVVVVHDGYLWNGIVFTSLSSIAREITGTSWNGWTFFGISQPRRRVAGPIRAVRPAEAEAATSGREAAHA